MSEKISGKSKGGQARALALTPKRRKEIAMKGVLAKRERASLPRAICGADDKLLVIGNMEIQCFVLDDETRVLTLRTLQSGIGMSEGGGKGGVRKIPALMVRLAEKDLDIMGLDVLTNNPIKFITPSGKLADGYNARMLPDICAVLIEADRKKLLDKRSAHIAERAAKLQHGFATMGIIALVDKVTGYENFKKATDFAKIIEAFVAKDMKPYIPKFPPEYYEQICRLRSVPYDLNSVKRPAYFGHLTNNITYRRLAPGVWKELKEKSKKKTMAITKPHLHRFLTEDIGDPRLKDVISQSIAVMKLSDDWFDFLEKLDRVLPLQHQQLKLRFNMTEDSGVGF